MNKDTAEIIAAKAQRLEREKIVDYLRHRARIQGPHRLILGLIANAIERGEHREPNEETST